LIAPREDLKTIMFSSLRLGKWFGIPVYLHSTFLLLPILVAVSLWGRGGWATFLFQTALMLAVFACVLLHEFGHALMARRFGIRTRDVTLYPIGGVARLERLSEKPVEELLITLAGPAVNLAIALVLSPLALWVLFTGGAGFVGLVIPPGLPFSAILIQFFFGLWASNIILFLFNLLPIFPMDGGRVLRSLLASITTHMRATEIAAAVGMLMAFGLGALGIFTGQFMILILAFFVIVAGQHELQALRYRHAQSYPAYPAVPVQTVWPAPPPASAPTPRPYPLGFTGIVWDQANRVWIQWYDGQPVAVFTE
jgi:Zn-dependent protease